VTSNGAYVSKPELFKLAVIIAGGRSMKAILPLANTPKPCVFMTETSQLIRLTETELWALLDEVQQWGTSGFGRLSSAAEVILASRRHSAKCEEVFDLWRTQVKASIW
jgi:hypothetical protein